MRRLIKALLIRLRVTTLFSICGLSCEVVPAQQLTKDPSDSWWISTGSDPQFALYPAGWRRPWRAGWLLVEIALDFEGEPKRARLYWNEGQKFSESKVHLLPLPADGRIRVLLPFPKRLEGLRLDPMDFAGRFRLGKVKIRRLSKVAVALHVARPYFKKAVLNPRRYAGLSYEVYHLWRRQGLAPIGSAIQRLAQSRNPAAVRNYIHMEYVHSQAHAKSNRPAMAPAGDASVSVASVRPAKSDTHTIGIGLVEHFGDIVACEPITRYLKKQNPKSQICWVVGRAYRELVASNPYIDKVVAVDCLTDWIKLSNHDVFDETFDLHVNGRICQDCNIALEKTRGDPRITGHNYFNFGSLLASFCMGAGLPPLEEQPRVYIPDSAVAAVDKLNLPERFIVFHCCSNDVEKDWEAANWNELAERIWNATNIPIVEVGLESMMAHDGRQRIDLCRRTSLLETAEVIRRSELFVGIDSGPAHLGNAVGAPGVVLLGDYKGFKNYNPFTGAYADGTLAHLVYSQNGPAADLPVDEVFGAVAARLQHHAETKRHARAKAPDKPERERSLATTSIETKELSRREQGTNGDSHKQPASAPAPVRLIAFYLPQYHPIPENDKHWGKGFTEWRNVTKAAAFFKNHDQPRLPGELGFYDLRLPEIMNQQAELAREHGIHGFCYYYYWFQGKRLLHLPIDNLLQLKKPEFPFCFCWANENWTRRWDGAETEIIMAQEHTYEDDLAFIRNLIPAFEDPRYIRVDGKPLLLIYRTELFPNPARTAETWRNEVGKAGLGDLYLVRCEGFDPFTTPEEIGFDASYEVPSFILPEELRYDRIADLDLAPDFAGNIFDYEKIVKFYCDREEVSHKRHRGLMLAFDNTPRHGRKALIFHNASPEKYARWLSRSIELTVKKFRGQERLIFINAWNEWAEGSYLEPDLKSGRAYLQATKSAASHAANWTPHPNPLPQGERERKGFALS